MAQIVWDEPTTTKKEIIWDKPDKPVDKTKEIIWNKPTQKKDIVWNKQIEGNIDWEGSEKDSFKKMSNFNKVLDLIGRPGYAVKSVLKQTADETTQVLNQMGIPREEFNKMSMFDPRRTEIAKVVRQQDYNLKNKLSSAWRGLSGQERVTANQLWGEAGVKGVPFLGFATEIMLDPLMWGGGAGYKAMFGGAKAIVKPTIKGITKGIGVTVKGLEKLPKIGKAVTTAKETLPSMVSGLKNMFVTKSGIGKLSELVDRHLLKREYLKGKEIRYATKVRNVIQNTAKKYNIGIDDVEKQVVNVIEQPQLAGSAAPEIRTLSNTLRTHFENLLTSEMKAGVPITHLAGGARNIEYFPRITSSEARQYLKQAKVGSARIWNPKLANSLKRKTGDFTLGEFNDFVKVNGLESLGGKSVEQFFMRSPAYATATRGLRSAKAVTSAQFLDDVGKTFGMASDDAAKKGFSFYQELPDTITRLNPSLKGKVFEPEVFSEISRVTPKYFNPNELKTATRAFDAIQNTWKRWTLAPFPKYHLRNMIGNMWNNYLADVQPKNYPKAQALQMYRKFKHPKGKIGLQANKTAIAELKALGITPQQADDIIKAAEQTGVLGQGWYGADIETTIEKSLKGKGGITGRGMAFGSTIENNARLAHFVDRVDKAGMLRAGAKISDDIAYQASTSVKKFLFDYGDLTAFEKQVMKRLFPFYTWTRKNIPLQLEQFATQPQKFAPLAISLRNRDPKDLLRLKYARPDLYERLPVELRRDADTVTYVPLEGLIPAGDLTKMVRPQEILIELLTPYLRAPIELAMNKSFYFESEIQKYPEETQELLRMDIPVNIKYALTTVLPQARLLNELNKLVKKQVRKQELTPAEQAFSQSLSSIYKVNTKDLKDRALRRIEKKIEDLRTGMFWAKTNKRVNEEKRIKETYNKLKGLMKTLK